MRAWTKIKKTCYRKTEIREKERIYLGHSSGETEFRVII